MERIDTSLGTLHLDDEYCKNRLKAELRGLELLCSIVNSSPVWSFNLDSEKPFLSSNDDGPTILVDIFQCMQRRLLEDDAHLAVYMSQVPVCILKGENRMDTPSTDSIVSLVLLGIAGWPIESTPSSLGEKAIRSGTHAIQDSSKLLPSDWRQIQSALHLYEEGFIHACISILAQMARRWYVCRCWEVGKVREVLEPILERVTGTDLITYLEHPDESSDALFLSV